jgi:hypothetical protein
MGKGDDVTNASTDGARLFQRLIEADANLKVVEWDVGHYGRYLTTSTTTIHVPEWLYERFRRAGEEYREDRKAVMERAFA